MGYIVERQTPTKEERRGISAPTGYTIHHRKQEDGGDDSTEIYLLFQRNITKLGTCFLTGILTKKWPSNWKSIGKIW